MRTPPGLEERFRTPPGLRWNFFGNADGARIRYSHTPAAAQPAVGAVVLMHGFTEFGEKYFEVIRELSAHGYDVWQMDWRGYGGSDRYLADREKGHSLGVSRDTRDLEQFVRGVVKAAPGMPLVLIAQSMGGQLAVRYLHDYPGRFHAAVLCSPFLSLAPGAAPGIPLWLVSTIIWGTNTFGFGESWAVGNGPWQNRIIPGFSHDPVRAEIQRRWSQTSPVLRIGGVTNRWVREYTTTLDAVNQPSFYSAIHIPVLLGSASEDFVTSPAVHASACSQMPNCKLMTFHGAWHELFMESEPIRAAWMSGIFQFLAATAAAGK